MVFSVDMMDKKSIFIYAHTIHSQHKLYVREDQNILRINVADTTITYAFVLIALLLPQFS